MLNNLIGRKGKISSLKDYWDVATFFEMSVLAGDYAKAVTAAERMFALNSPSWYLKSTIKNISLIQTSKYGRGQEAIGQEPEEKLFEFWQDFFVNATEEANDNTIRFPILIMEPSKIYMPSYVTVNVGDLGDVDQESSIHIENLCAKCLRHDVNCKQVHEWNITPSMIKTLT